MATEAAIHAQEPSSSAGARNQVVAVLMDHDQAAKRHRKGGDGGQQGHASAAVKGKRRASGRAQPACGLLASGAVGGQDILELRDGPPRHVG